MGKEPGTDPIHLPAERAAVPKVNRVRPRFSGFTLVEILVVLLIFGILLSMAAVVTRAVTSAQKHSVTMTRLAGVEAAILQFVQQQKRLPCPGDGRLVSTAMNAGTEGRTAGVCDNNQQYGVVPWRALGLTELEATDGWDRRLTLRIDGALAADNGMNMSWCDPAGTEGGAAPRACNTGCTNSNLAACTPPAAFLSTRGLTVKNSILPPDQVTIMNPNASPHTGAAYVLVSHGATGGGGYTSNGQLAPSVTTDGTEEMKNYASLAYVSAAVTYYVSDTINENAGTAHFDDLVVHPSVLTVVTKAGLGPRSH